MPTGALCTTLMGQFLLLIKTLACVCNTMGPTIRLWSISVLAVQMTQQPNRIIDYAVMGRLNQGGGNTGSLMPVPLVAALLTCASDHIAVRYILK